MISSQHGGASGSRAPGSSAPLRPGSPAQIEQLRAEAEERIWYAPRQGWELAEAAYTAAKRLTPDLLLAECALTLAVALNALGRFAEALPLLDTAVKRFLTCDRPDGAGRCWAEAALAGTYLGQFESAQTALTRARDVLSGLDSPLAQAHCDRAEGLFHLAQNRYPEAAAPLHRAGNAFTDAGRQGEAALTWCDLAETLHFADAQEALNRLDQARRVPVPGDAPVHAARCDHVLGLIYDELNRYAESLALYRQARATFAAEGMDFMAARCDLDEGIAHYRLNQYEQALAAYSRARASFAVQELSSYVTICDLNTAIVYYAINRYAEALALYQRAAEAALAEGRVLRAARCYTNMGLCYDRLARYDRALALHDRAREAFLASGSAVHAALCQENLAGTHRALGRHEEALEHYRRARETFAGQGMYVYLARCDTHMADLHLALDRHEEALACLEQARATCQQEGLAVHVAACDREIARVRARMGRGEEALGLLDRAKTVFAGKGLLVDAALCDLAAGEVYRDEEDAAEAMPLFRAVLAVLDPGFPDEAWRAWYGLGHCALIQGDPSRALEHWLSAVELTSRMRAVLPTERLSGGFFASRRRLYEETLKLALDLGATEQALAVAEASKAQTFLALRLGSLASPPARPGSATRARGQAGQALRAEGWPGQRGWGESARDDPYLADLLSQQERLRAEMESLRRELRLLEADQARPILRGEGEPQSDQPQALARLAELARAYEEVVERLRLAGPGLPEAHSQVTFSIQELRRAAATHLPPRWGCLSYYLLDDSLITFYLDAERLSVHRRPLTAYDRLALRRCADPAGQFRELIYRGTIRGHRAPGAPGRTYLQHLRGLLMPPQVDALGEDGLLLIAPHGALHGLAFQALLCGDMPLVTQVPLMYVPSLGALQMLLRAEPFDYAQDRRVEGLRETPRNDVIRRVLVCGLSDFGSEARPLSHTADEVAGLREVLGERVRVLWGAEATREALLRLNDTGELASYDVVHFVTHAVLDRLAPSQSRVLLADDSLTLVDILNLRLAARLVVLSACEGAMGERYPGDEIMGLARAFFVAGARTVVASLWSVEDASAGEFMARFYRRLRAGENVAQALRAVQMEMAGEGYLPYQWAPFIAIGLL